MAARGQEGSWWTQPLPSNWEAKWDPNQKRYFFIDHVNKETSWEDPRQRLWQQHQQRMRSHQQRPPYNNQQYSHGASPRGGAGRDRSPQPPSGPERQELLSGRAAGASNGENIPLQDMSPSKPAWQKKIEQDFDVSFPSLHDDFYEDEKQSSNRSASGQSRVSLGHYERRLAVLKKRSERTGETSFTDVDEVKFNRLKDQFPTAEEELIRTCLRSNKNVEGMAIGELQMNGHKRYEDPEQAALARLVYKIKLEFPMAPEGVVKDVWSGVNNDEGKLRHELRNLGYHPVHADTHKPHERHLRSPVGTIGDHRITSPGRSPPRFPSTTAAEKTAMEARFTEEFVDVESSIIAMALSASRYDETKARALIRTMNSPYRSTTYTKADERMGTSDGHYHGGADYRMEERAPKKREDKKEDSPKKTSTQRSSPTPVTYQTTAGTAPVTYGDTGISSVISDMGGLSSPTGRSFANWSSSSTSPSLSGTYSAATSSRNAQRRVQFQTPSIRSTPPPGSTISGTDQFISPNRIQPKGPDRSLVRGPDKSLLIDHYVSESGPNPGNRVGPVRANAVGPVAPLGPDRRYAQGPMPSASCGPNHSFVSGRIYPHHDTMRTPYITAL